MPNYHDNRTGTDKAGSNRERLATGTAHQLNQLSPDAIANENSLAIEMASLSRGIDFDQEF